MADYSNINFLREQVRLQEEVLEKDKKFATITSGVVGVFMIIVVFVFLYQLFLLRQESKLTEATQKEESTLQGFASLRANLVERDTRLSTIRGIFDTRSKKWEAIQFFYTLFPPEITIGNADLGTGESAMELSLQAKTLPALKQVLTILQDPALKEKGYVVELGSFSRSLNGQYDVQVSVDIVTSEPKKS